MYGWLWQHLPGPWPARAAIALALAAAVVAVCFAWLFPAVADHLVAPTQTVGG